MEAEKRWLAAHSRSTASFHNKIPRCIRFAGKDLNFTVSHVLKGLFYDKCWETRLWWPLRRGEQEPDWKIINIKRNKEDVPFSHNIVYVGLCFLIPTAAPSMSQHLQLDKKSHVHTTINIQCIYYRFNWSFSAYCNSTVTVECCEIQI